MVTSMQLHTKRAKNRKFAALAHNATFGGALGGPSSKERGCNIKVVKKAAPKISRDPLVKHSDDKFKAALEDVQYRSFEETSLIVKTKPEEEELVGCYNETFGADYDVHFDEMTDEDVQPNLKQKLKEKAINGTRVTLEEYLKKGDEPSEKLFKEPDKKLKGFLNDWAGIERLDGEVGEKLFINTTWYNLSTAMKLILIAEITINKTTLGNAMDLLEMDIYERQDYKRVWDNEQEQREKSCLVREDDVEYAKRFLILRVGERGISERLRERISKYAGKKVVHPVKPSCYLEE